MRIRRTRMAAQALGLTASGLYSRLRRLNIAA
jgi:hypothetical protein